MDLREPPRLLVPEEHQSLPPPAPPAEGSKLHDLLGQDPENARKFFNLTKWPPPSHLLHVQRTLGNEHLTDSRPHLVLKWVKEIAAARPELLTRNGAVRYLLNTLKDTLRTDYTRRGEPMPEDAQLASRRQPRRHHPGVVAPAAGGESGRLFPADPSA